MAKRRNQKVLDTVVKIYNYMINVCDKNDIVLEQSKSKDGIKISNSMCYQRPDGYLSLNERFNSEKNLIGIDLYGYCYNGDNFKTNKAGLFIWFELDNNKIFYTRDSDFLKNKLNIEQIELETIKIIDNLKESQL